jgi:hypothetical protein
MKMTFGPESPGPSYRLDGVNVDEHGRLTFLWKRCYLKVGLLLIAGAAVGAVIAWGLCN